MLRSVAVAALVALSSSVVACAAPDGADDEAAADEGHLEMSNDEGALVKVPFYFAMPKSSLSGPLNRQKYSYATLWNPAREDAVQNLGLRVIAVPEQGEPGSVERRGARQRMAKELARAGVIQDGDVVLSFRPELADTMAYPHIQMGSTHAGLAFTRGEGDAAQGYNVDQPLDTDYNVVDDGKFVGRFDSMHYAGCVASDRAPAGAIKCKKSSSGAFIEEGGVDALHILRPRGFSDRQKQNLGAWLDTLGKAHARIRDAGGLNFNSDYLKPLLANPAYRGSLGVTVTKLGKILLGLEAPPQDFDMFCSELAFHLITLANCTEADIRAAGETATCATEEAAPFKPMKLVDPENGGLADGPLLDLMAGRPDPAAAGALLDSIFATNASGANKLSSGHRRVAETVAPLMGGVQQYYRARLGAPEQAGAIADQLNAQTGGARNYSPTAFLVNAALPSDHALRKVDYVATVVFTPAASVDKAKRLAQSPVP
jgi:hypothetical protein